LKGRLTADQIRERHTLGAAMLVIFRKVG